MDATIILQELIDTIHIAPYCDIPIFIEMPILYNDPDPWVTLYKGSNGVEYQNLTPLKKALMTFGDYNQTVERIDFVDGFVIIVLV